MHTSSRRRRRLQGSESSRALQCWRGRRFSRTRGHVAGGARSMAQRVASVEQRRWCGRGASRLFGGFCREGISPEVLGFGWKAMLPLAF
jgi:hypothetical protein